MASGVYLDTERQVWDGTLVFNPADLKLALMDATFAPDRTVAPATWGAGQFSGHEVSGTGYTAGGEPVTGFAIAIVDGELRFSCDDITWTGASFTTRWGVLRQVTEALAIYVVDFGFARTVSGADFPVRLSGGLWANPQ